MSAGHLFGENLKMAPWCVARCYFFQFGIDVSRIAQQSDRDRLSQIARFAYLIERLVQRAGDCIAVAGIQAALNVLLHLHSTASMEAPAIVDSEWLRTAHPSQTRSQYPFTG